MNCFLEYIVKYKEQSGKNFGGKNKLINLLSFLRNQHKKIKQK